MASIVELYRQHKDLLSPYFKSEEDAAECERRAEMGDDRAMRVITLAFSARYKHKYKYVAGTSDIEGPWEVREGEPNWVNVNACIRH